MNLAKTKIKVHTTGHTMDFSPAEWFEGSEKLILTWANGDKVTFYKANILGFAEVQERKDG